MFRSLIIFISVLFVSASSMAKDKPILTVYSYDSFLSEWGPGEKIKSNFEAQCDCQLNVVSTGDGVSILNRLRLEGSKSKADIILGLDTNLINVAKKANLVQPHQIKRPNNLAVDWWDDEFVPYDHGNFAFIYNKNNILKPPHSFDELLSDSNHWKIIYQDPRTSTPGLGLLLWLNRIYGDKTPETWKKLASKTLTVTKGWSEAYGMFLKNEADFVLSYTTSPVVHIINDNDHRYHAAIFDEGNYEQIEVVGIVKQSHQKELAQKFIQFLLTNDVQSQFVDKNVMYPAIDIPLPAAYNEIDAVKKSLSFTSYEVQKNQKKWIKEWQNAVSQ